MWNKEKIRMVMYVCIIMHNMIIEDDGKAICQYYFPKDVVEGTQAIMEERILNGQLLHSNEIHNALKADLVKHAWVIRPIQHDGDVEQDSKEEEIEEFEVGSFKDGGLDDGENEEEE
ncbi:putative harbinger transposase-derived protein [Helianthus annuus]|nr:putative harbinger transposase-derived protein [Helianthus annuus]